MVAQLYVLYGEYLMVQMLLEKSVDVAGGRWETRSGDLATTISE
jgi:hypothetical protein